jgi:hypothetical protein
MLLMEHTCDEAMTSVYEYLAKHYKALEIPNPHHTMQMKEVPATYLLRMYIFGVQADALKAVQLESTSPRLRTTLKRFFGVPPLIPIP